MLNNFQSPGEVAFYVFGMPVYFYGIIMAVAVFVGFCVTNYLYKISVATPSPLEGEGRGEGKNNFILDISPWLIISGIIGARLYYCLVNYSYYIQKPLEIFFIRQGGLSIHGAIIAGALALFYFSKRYKIPFLCLTDIFLCGTILAQSIGRWGNFFNSEAFGLPCDLPWKLYIPISHRPLEYINFEYFHPTFFYESLLDFCVFVVLIWVAIYSRKWKVESGKFIKETKQDSSYRKSEKQGDSRSFSIIRYLSAKFIRYRTGQILSSLTLTEFVPSGMTDRISQTQQSDTNPSTLQPSNLSTNNNLPLSLTLPLGEGSATTTPTIQPFNCSNKNSYTSIPLYLHTSNSSGLITSLYLILYASARIFVEHFRIDSALNIFGIPIAQIVSVAMLCFGVALLKFTKQDNRP